MDFDRLAVLRDVTDIHDYPVLVIDGGIATTCRSAGSNGHIFRGKIVTGLHIKLK
jgi:pantothenate kinase type III